MNRFCAFAALCALAAGCGGPAVATISGDVSVDGKPLAKGTIAYVAADGSGVVHSASITNGHYEITTTPGKKIVQITAPVVARQFKYSNGMSVDVPEESLPDRYHAKSELEFDVKPGSNKKDWQLEGKAKAG